MKRGSDRSGMSAYKITAVTIAFIIQILMFGMEGMCVSAARTGPRHLIQATSYEDEYTGLLELGMLTVEPLETGVTADAVALVRPCIVRLRTGALTGSGIIVRLEKDTAIIASNRHQLSAGKYSAVTLWDGRQIRGVRTFVSSKYDLGFIEADISKISYEKRKELRIICPGDSNVVAAGDRMFLTGSADGVAANVYEGSVADPMYYFPEFGSYMVYGHCRAKAGMSGGGAFDMSGRCIGMITGGVDDDTASLPIDFVEEELNNRYK